MPLTKQDFLLLAEACITSLIAGQYDSSIDVIFPLGTILPEDMPRGMPQDQSLPPKDPMRQTHRTIGAKKLLKWLYKAKYSPWGWEDVCSQKKCFSQAARRIEEELLRGIEIDVDIPQGEGYNTSIEIGDEEHGTNS